MFVNGSLVTLIIDKRHGEGENALMLRSGICGLVAQATRRNDGNHTYVIDFGAEGQWNCVHNELSGEDREGWDEVIRPENIPIYINNEEEREEENENDLEFINGPIEDSKIVPDKVISMVDADIQKRIQEIEQGNY